MRPIRSAKSSAFAPGTGAPAHRASTGPVTRAVAALTSVVLAGSVAGCDFGGEEQAIGEIVIAADLELTGVAAATGGAYQRALELKIQQINDSGVLGGQKIRLDVKDNRSDPNESLRNINNFTADPAVQAIIMGSCSECAMGAAKTLTDKKVPAVTLAPATRVVNPVEDARYLFKLAPNAAHNAAALAAELKRQDIRKVALLHSDDSYGQDGLRAMTDELEKARIKLVEVRAVKPTSTDVDQAVTRLVGEEPDGLVVWTAAEQAALAAGAADKASYDGKLFFDAGAAGSLFLGKSGKATDGTLLVFTQTMVIDDVIATTPALAARKEWFREYTSRYGGYYGFSSFAADAIQLITDAIIKSGSTADDVKRDDIRAVLETTQIDGLSGPIRITPDNHSGLMPQALTMLVARSGRWRLAG